MQTEQPDNTTPTSFVEGTPLPSVCPIDVSELMSEEQIRALVYDSIDEELLAVGDQAAQMRANIRMWSRLTRDKVAEIVMRVVNVVTSGSWLSVRLDQTTERLDDTYYISSREGIDDVQRLMQLTESDVVSDLPYIEEKYELHLFVMEVIKKLNSKLHQLWEAATSVRPLSLFYETRWVTAWRLDVLSPTPAEVDAYEAEIAQILAADDTETRRSVLRAAIDYEREAIDDNPWGDTYLKHRDDLRQLVKAISAKRFNDGGDDLDALRHHARKYEWLMAELEKLPSPALHATTHMIFHQPVGSISFNDIHDNNNIAIPQ